jgi:hypothetical protein
MIHRQFFVDGSPVSVNRYGQPAYKTWRAAVHTASMSGLAHLGPLVPGWCTVKIRYFRHLDRMKDVDNILKAILDGLDGRIGGRTKATDRILTDDHYVERVISQRTNLEFHTALNARSLSTPEYRAAFRAFYGQASVYVSVESPPNQAMGI